MHSKADIPKVTRAFADFRQPRTAKIQAAARYNIIGFTLPDGPYQQGRDEKIKTTEVDDAAVEVWNDMPLDPNADFLDPKFFKWLLAYDAIDAVSLPSRSISLLR